MKKRAQVVKRYMAWYDLHWGFEADSDLPQPHQELSPIHNEACLNAALRFADEFKPDYMIFGGDMLDGKALSHWNRHKPLLTENLRIGSDMKGFKRNVLRPLERLLKPTAQKIYLPGNHERFWIDLAQELPGIADLLDLREILQLGEHGWEWHRLGATYKLGKVYFTHGDVALRSGGKHAAKRLVEQYHRSVRAGHVHTAQQYMENTAVDASDFHDGKIVPCMCSRAPLFMKQAPNAWVNGLLVGYLTEDGGFWDEIKLFVNGAFMHEGRIIRG
jgi:hypothetical protein